MIRPRLLLFFLALTGCAPSAWCRSDFQIRCEDTLPKTVSVLSAHQNGYSIDTQVSYRMLTRMGSPAAGGMVLGLTRMNSRVEMGLAGQSCKTRPAATNAWRPRSRWR